MIYVCHGATHNLALHYHYFPKATSSFVMHILGLIYLWPKKRHCSIIEECSIFSYQTCFPLLFIMCIELGLALFYILIIVRKGYAYFD
jgi:hypothetical protein